MVSIVALFLTGLSPGALQDAPEFVPGPRVVQMRVAKYYSAPKFPRKKVGQAKYGEKVTALALEGRYVKVKRPNGSEAYIFKGALIEPDRFNPHPENDQEKMALNAQNYKSGRFDNDTEQEYIKQKGPKMRQAYQAVDALMTRSARRAGTADSALEKFRRDGKLGEFSSVK